MRYRVRYSISAARIVDNSSDKRTTFTKVSDRIVILPDIDESPENKKVHKAIRDVLVATHAKNEHLDEKHITIKLLSVIRLVAPKRADFIRDHWVAEPVEESMEPLPADPNALLKDKPKREKDNDDTPTDDKDNQENAGLEDEEDDWDDIDDESPKSTTTKKSTKKKAAKR